MIFKIFVLTCHGLCLVVPLIYIAPRFSQKQKPKPKYKNLQQDFITLNRKKVLQLFCNKFLLLILKYFHISNPSISSIPKKRSLTLNEFKYFLFCDRFFYHIPFKGYTFPTSSMKVKPGLFDKLKRGEGFVLMVESFKDF